MDTVADLSDPATVGRLVVRARRVGDLSQRELAMRVGVAPATVARLESGVGLPSLSLLVRILAAAGLHLGALDAKGAAVEPVAVDLVRDNQGRRFPAHLDVAAPDEVPRERWQSPRYDRARAQGWYHLREERDIARAAAPVLGERDHPTGEQLRRRERLIRGRQPRVDAPPRPEIECACPDVCFERACVPECACQCEPERGYVWRRDGA
ncbi:MAG: helix-turn-helix domain protein [Humibacillus sp.]|nr:helix-turn-helix domain protein [Humibacillus sp.]